MKYTLLLLVVFATIATFVAGGPIEQDDNGDFVEHIRARRATCDLLSVATPFGSLNHAACAAHCLAMFKGYRGGRCINGICNCRR